MKNKPVVEDDDLHKKVIQWAYDYLLSNQYILKSDQPENVRHTPWSYVIRFATTDGWVYLKHMPKLISLEPNITQILHDQFHASVPQVIAHNPALNCFLMNDAGRPLREILKKQFDVKLLCKAIHQFTSLQLKVAENVDGLINIGVPDWRIEKLPSLFQQFILQKDRLMTDGLSEIEIRELGTLLPKISNLCKKLFSYSIKPTLVQPDFNDNNLLIDNSQKITMIDLGEIVISHPFFSLINCLQQAKKHHGLTEEDSSYQKLLDACLINFMKLESRKRLLEAFSMAESLLFVYGALASGRLMKACGEAKLMSFQAGKLSRELRELISTFAALDKE